VLDAHLRGRQWLSGARLTLADYAVAVSLMRVKEANISLADHPQIAAWFERVQALEVWKRTQPS
jgi:glutathione S-transferase